MRTQPKWLRSFRDFFPIKRQPNKAEAVCLRDFLAEGPADLVEAQAEVLRLVRVEVAAQEDSGASVVAEGREESLPVPVRAAQATRLAGWQTGPRSPRWPISAPNPLS